MGIREELLDLAPDEPATFEHRARILDPTTEVFGHVGGAILKYPKSKKIVLIDDPDPALVASVLAGIDSKWAIGADRPRPDLAPGWDWEPTSTLVLTDPALVTAAHRASPSIRPLTREEILATFTEQTVHKVLEALERGPVIGAFVGRGDLAAMAYIRIRSERFHHPTLIAMPEYRGRGFVFRAIRAVVLLVELERQLGCLPVPTIPDRNTMVLEGCLRTGFQLLMKRWDAYLPK